MKAGSMREANPFKADPVRDLKHSLKSFAQWFVSKRKKTEQQTGNSYLVQLIAEAEQGAVMLHRAFDYEMHEQNTHMNSMGKSVLAAVCDRMFQQELPGDESLHVPHYVARTTMQNVLHSMDKDIFKMYEYWYLFEVWLGENYSMSRKTTHTGVSDYDMKKAYAMLPYQHDAHEEHYYSLHIGETIAKSATIILYWLQQHDALDGLVYTFVKTMSKIFPEIVQNGHLISQYFQGTMLNAPEFQNGFQHAFRLHLMSIFHTVMQGTVFDNDFPWEWQEPLIVDSFVEQFLKEKTMEAVIVEFFLLHEYENSVNASDFSITYMQRG